jgi:hypothetical protein
MRLSTPRPSHSAANAATGGTAAVPRDCRSCAATCPTFPATDAARPSSATDHAPARSRQLHRSVIVGSQASWPTSGC